MTKRYTLSFGQAIEHKPQHPERTARRSIGHLSGNVQYQVWSNREAMARSIRMQERGPYSPDHWKPVIPLHTTEGY